MKGIFTCIVLLAGILGINPRVNAQQSLSPTQMQQQAGQKKAVFLDVRTPQEWKKGHVKGATHLDLFNDNFEASLQKLDKNKTYYVYCAVGGRSAEAIETMQKLGFKSLYNMQGGFNAWKAAALPYEQ